MIKTIFSLFVFYYLLIASAFSASSRVELPVLATSDDPDVYITIFSVKAEEDLILPDIDLATGKYFEIFCNPEIGDEPNIAGMVIPKENSDVLYIDLNNDEDLTNDRGPFYFSQSENNFFFDVIFNNDPLRKTRIALRRKPVVADSLLPGLVDENGNMNKEFAKFAGMSKGIPGFTGQRGAFYFDDKVTLRRGVVTLNNKSFDIGVFDYNNNGLYDDNDDRLIVDLNGDHKLEVIGHEVFKINEVFAINEQNFGISELDKYGRWLVISETNENENFKLLSENAESSKHNAIYSEMNPQFWDMTFNTLDNDRIFMKNLRGKFLLLNFWGEWCGPCMKEIPDLKEIDKQITKDNFVMLSFAKTSRPDLVKKVIIEKEMRWPQVLLNEESEALFKLQAYPTNILILQDGKSCIRFNAVNHVLISSFIK